MRIIGSDTRNVLRSRSPLIVVGGAMLWGWYSGSQSCRGVESVWVEGGARV